MDFKFFNPVNDPLMVGLNSRLMMMLDSARDAAGVPFQITCGKRTPGENACLHGAVAESAHLSGLAVDLECSDDHALERMEFGLCRAGFVRRGLYIKASSAGKFVPHHIHVDIDDTKPQQFMWVLTEQN
jgi:uncharacterized protein YcbK (DUF882 family)